LNVGAIVFTCANCRNHLIFATHLTLNGGATT
jgi:hypothetical protein